MLQLLAALSRSFQSLGCGWAAGWESRADAWIPLLPLKPCCARWVRVFPECPAQGSPVVQGLGRGQEPAMDSLKRLKTGLGDVLLVKLL